MIPGGGGGTADTNTSPVAVTGESLIVKTGDVVQLNGSESYDPDGDLISYSWTILSLPGSSVSTLDDETAPTPSFTPDVDGDYVFKLIVTDGAGESEAVYLVVKARTENAPPTANAGQDQNVKTGRAVFLDGRRSSDPEGLPIGYAWAFTRTPDGSTASLDDGGLPTPSFTPDLDGEYELSLTVNDGVNESNPDQVLITSTPEHVNAVPIAYAGEDQQMLPGLGVLLSGNGTDADPEDTLSYLWSFVSIPEGSLAEIGDPTASEQIFLPDIPGSYVFALTVNDGKDESEPDMVVVTIGLYVPGISLPGVDLSGYDLAGATLTGGDFSGADLAGAVMAYADGSLADFSSALLISADCYRGVFSNADFTEADFSGVRLMEARLDSSVLIDANLTAANFNLADLSWSDMSGVVFSGTNLTSANLTGVFFGTVDFSGANLFAANLSDTDLTNATFPGHADLRSVNFARALLSGVNLYAARLDYSNMFEANFSGANLSQSFMYQVTMIGADFSGANLSSYTMIMQGNATGANMVTIQADMTGANLTDTRLSSANFAGANLTGAILTGANVNYALWSNTICPNGVNSDDNGGTCVGTY